MKRILLLLSAVILIAPGVMSQSTEQDMARRENPSSWLRYTVKGEEFSVQLPFVPGMRTGVTYQARLGKHRLERQLQTSLGDVVYAIDIFENPQPKQTLKEFIAEQNENARYDLTTERDVTVNEIAGKEYSSGKKTPPVTAQVFATERRFYRFSASGAGATHPGVKQFFSSIQLGKKPDGIEVYDNPGRTLEIDGERIYASRELDVKARIIAKPEPGYTEEARKNGVTGVVVLRAVLSKTGNVTNVRVVSGLPYGLTEKAIEAATKLQFTPAMKDGQNVSMWIQLEYHFNR
jgi:TonB family protein